MNNPFPNSVVTHPVYHGSNVLFDKFEITSDIGFHFGSKQAATERMVTTGGSPEFEIESDFPSKLDWYRQKASIYDGNDSKESLFYLLLRKLENPTVKQLRDALSKMSDNEVHELLSEYSSYPDSKSYKKSIDTYNNSSRKFYITNNGTRVNDDGFDVLTDAESELKKYKSKYLEPRKFWIDIKHPIQMKDLGTWSVLDIVRELNLDEDVSEYIMSADSLQEKYDRLKTQITNRGYDGIAYTNKVEDSGSRSYIVFNDNQIHEIKDNTIFESEFNSKVMMGKRPLPVYRGISTSRETRHPSSKLGTFFSPNKRTAESYAGDMGTVTKYAIEINNPYVMNAMELQSIKNESEASQIRRKLLTNGYDGIFVKPYHEDYPNQISEYIVFNDNQIHEIKKTMNENSHDKFIDYVERYRKYDPVLVECILSGHYILFGK